MARIIELVIFDILSWLFGAFAVTSLVLALRPTPGLGRPVEVAAAQALTSVTAPERLLWRQVVRRGLANPESRLSRMVPSYGVRGATQAVVAHVWLIFVYPAFPAMTLQDNKGGIAKRVGWVLMGIAILSLLFSFYRLVTAFRSGRTYRRRHAGSGE